jgi:3-keto-disaccharide hydrolase
VPSPATPVFSFAVALSLIAAAPLHAQSPQWTSLFNGKDFTDWQHVGPGEVVLDSGMMRTHGGMGLLWYTPRKIGNSVIRVVYKTADKQANSGVFIRIPLAPTEPWLPVYQGYEVQIDDNDDDWHTTGTLYSLTKALSRPGKPGEWNTMEITLDGPHTIVFLNGVKITDYTEGQPVPPKKFWYEPDRNPARPSEGYIGIQNHKEKDTVWFKEISVRPLK